MRNAKKWISYLLILCMVLSSPATMNVVAAGVQAVEAVQELESTSDTQAETEEPTEVSTQEQTQVEIPQTPEQSEVDTQRANNVIYEDGVKDNWGQDPATIKGGEICTVENKWLHLKAGSSNGNNPSVTSPPAVFTTDVAHDFSQDGFFEVDMRTVQAGSLNRVGIYLGYTDQFNGMFFGYNTGGWYWQKYGAGDAWSNSTGTVPAAGSTVKVRIEWAASKKASLFVDGQALYTDIDISSYGTMGNQIGIKCGTFSTEISDIYLKNIHYTGQAEAETHKVSGKIIDEDSNPIVGAKVTIEDVTVATDVNGLYEFEQIVVGSATLTAMKKGFQTHSEDIVVLNNDLVVNDITLEKKTELPQKMISSDQMEVYVAEHFPSVIKYVLKNQGNKEFAGQEEEINTITVNEVDIKLTSADVVGTFSEANKASYVMTVKNEQKNIDAVIKAELVVEKNILAFNITEIKNNLDNNSYPIQTLYIPNHSLISINSEQEQPNLKGASMSSTTAKSGDTYLELKDDTANKKMDYMYAFISNKELSAGLWSNAEYEGSAVHALVSGGSRNTRVMATIADGSGFKTLGLGSTPWYYQRKIKTKGIDYVVKETDLPKTKIIITGDQNDDGQVDWQDGAIAFREIMHNPYKSEEVPELVAWRIAMNFSGQAANPFLTTLDNVKRVALNTDGLGQSVLLKGYGNEGHDSGHPDYADIGKRIGGAKDMNTLMEKGKAFGAKFGIHVNASEMYPEAKAFNEQLVRYKQDGVSLSYGWNWLDKAVGIDAYYDLGSGARRTRFNDLKAQIGDNMDFVYVDVWGNQTTGIEDSWETRQLSKEIIDNDWRVTTEWGAANEYDSTFQHWATDLSYGGYDFKGINSEVMRFLRNHQKDSWIGDYPSYFGAANAPLLGGYNMKDFEGWQGRNDYDAYIENLFTHDLSTKFLQHYKIMKWVDGDPVRYAKHGKLTADYDWIPEMEITLQDDSKQNTVVVTRGSNDKDSPLFRSRTMTLNGKEILKGTMSAGNSTSLATRGTESYLLPWVWDAENGTALNATEQRLYHWNTQGGTSTWDLPDGWENLSSVVVYKLTDEGKTEQQTVAVSNGSITLTADARTIYVVYQGEQGNISISWSEGMHIVDAGFNGGFAQLDQNWNKAGTGTATIAKSQFSNPMLKLDGDIKMSQKLTNLVPGTKYAVYVGVDNRSDAKAWVSLETAGKEIVANYTTKSIAKNYVQSYAHNTRSATVAGSSYFQNLYVFFTAPSTEVTLSLKREAGSGDTYFDDIRVVENNSHNITRDGQGNIIKFEQDFETVAQGLYPFVVGPIEGVEDNRTHLSERHAPYTQAGWNVKEVSDVLGGDWSVKTNGLVGRNALVYQTIPQNFRFEPGERYKVRFDYQAGYDDTYAFAIGTGEFTNAMPEKTNLKGTLVTPETPDKTRTLEFDVLGDDSGQTWIGFYSTNVVPPIDRFATEADADFSGINDLIVDNVVIEKVIENTNSGGSGGSGSSTSVDKAQLEKAIKEYENLKASDYTTVSWKAFDDAYKNAQTIVKKADVTQADVDKALNTLNSAQKALDIKVVDEKLKLKAPKSLVVKSSSYNQLKLSWKKVSEAQGYEIYRSTKKASGFKLVATIKSGNTVSYSDSKLTTGTVYYYKVRAYATIDKEKIYSNDSGIKSQKPVLAITPLATVKYILDKKIKITWKKVNGANGYVVYRATSKKGEFKKVATIKKGSTITYTNSNLKNETTYYYKVRAYRNENGKIVFGPYSTVKYAKVKK